jgi:hypothetical protein
MGSYINYSTKTIYIKILIKMKVISEVSEKRMLEILSKTNKIFKPTNKKSSTTLFCEQIKKLREFAKLDEIENINKKTDFDQKREEENFTAAFKNLNVHIKFFDLIITDDFIYWGGLINGIILFAYRVTDDKQTSGIDFEYLNDFDPDNPENDKIIKLIKSYYDTFFQYWNSNLMQK